MEERKYNKKYYVVFDVKKHYAWWNIFLDRDVCHCFVITGCVGGCIEIQPSVGGTRIYCYDISAEKMSLLYLQKGYKIVECFVRDTKTPRLKLFRTCVSMVKDLLGIKNPFVITAKQLYKEIT